MKELILIQSELKAPKGQRNTFGNYSYRSLEDIFEALKPLIKQHECFVTTNDEVVMAGDRIYIKATATITNSKGESISNTAYAREPQIKKGMDEAQITGATSSYARKYALNGLFAIDDTKDADATNDGKDKAPASQSNPNADFVAICKQHGADPKTIASIMGVDSKKPQTVINALNDMAGLMSVIEGVKNGN